jgi:methyltransferase (TIGR00027 family)
MIQDVSDTAIWVATYRAWETERPDALFKDPLAARLAGERGAKIAKAMPGGKYTAWSLAIRTYIIDAYLRERIAAGVTTVVNLGAGLDTRPYRLELPPELLWVEVDFPHMIDFKEERLRGELPRCRLERVKLDLANREARRALLAAINARSTEALVLTEGVIPYLSNDEVASLADDLRALDRFRGWILDYFAPEVRKFMDKRRKKQMKNAPFRFAPEDWLGFFSQHGWKLAERRYLVEVTDQVGRSPPAPWWAKLVRPFFPRHKREAFRKFFGYAVLMPG